LICTKIKNEASAEVKNEANYVSINIVNAKWTRRINEFCLFNDTVVYRCVLLS